MTDQLTKRTKVFALRIIDLVQTLPKTRTAQVIGTQLLRSGTSIGANYRASCRARSRADFIAKMGIVEEEADESVYWLELLMDSGLLQESDAKPLVNEANELVAMTVASIKTAKRGTGRIS